MKKTLSMVLLAVVLIASIGFAPAVYAEDTDIDMQGAGKLTAHGDGIALLAGGGIVEMRGNGVLWIKDIAGNARIDVKGFGRKKEFGDGWTQYSGLYGSAQVKGRNVKIVVAGVGIDLRAKGYGRVILWGHGTYDVNGVSGRWATEELGKSITIAPSSEQTDY